VIIYVGIGLLEWNILNWFRRDETRIDGVVSLLVLATTLAFDLMAGMGTGMLGSVLLFMRQQASGRVIHEQSTGKEHHSLLYRTEEERNLLDTHGDRIVYIELRGNLFFGTADRLFTRLPPYLNRPVWMILKLGSGSFFGEVAFLDPGPRTATAVVTQNADLLALNRKSFDSLKEDQHKEAAWAVLHEVAESTSRQLRWAQSELRRLERW
jgi:MFS superfamily sulfate permease-like transporter